MNDAFTTIEQELQVEAGLDSVKVNKADKTTDAYWHTSTDSDDRIDVDNITNDEQRDLMIHDGFEMNMHPRSLDKNYKQTMLLTSKQIL